MSRNDSIARKLLSLAVGAAAVFIAAVVLPVAAHAETDGIWTYAVNADKAGVTVTKCSTRSGSITIPSTLGGLPVTGIGITDYDEADADEKALLSSGSYAFMECTTLTSVTFPDTLKTIGYYAFEGCSELTSITLPDGLTTLGVSAFENCAALSSVTLPGTLTLISDEAFECCSSLPRITLPDSVTSIGTWAFYDCSELSSINIPEGVTAIGAGAFTNCFKLTALTLPGSIDRVGARAFDGCGFKSVTIASRSGSSFNGWYTEASGGTLIESSQTIKITGFDLSNGTKSLYTQWKSASTTEQTNSYSDVEESEWFYNAVTYVTDGGLMNGTGSDAFSPDTPISRAMTVTVLWRLEGEPSPSSGCTFTDVLSGEYYVSAVAWAQENGIVKGYDANTFGVNDSITREQLAAIFYRYASYKGYGVTASYTLSSYADYSSISDWALAPMQWATAKKLITGVTSTTLVPQGTATRAQTAEIIKRFVENVKG